MHQTDPEAAVENLSPEMAAAVAQQAAAATTDQLLRQVDGLAELDARLRWASNKRLHLELGVIQAVEAMSEVSLGDVIDAIDKAGGTGAEAAHIVQARRAAAPVQPLSPPPARVVTEPRHVNPPSAPKRDDDPAPMGFDDEPPAEQFPAANPTPQPAPAAVAEPSCDGDHLWQALMPVVNKKRPLIAHWVQAGTQLSFKAGVLKIGFPTAEAHSCESLKRDATRAFLEDCASDLAAARVKLDLVVDANLTLPPAQDFFMELEPAPQTPAATIAPAAPAAQGTPEPAPAAVTPVKPAVAEPPPDNSFYQDDLIQAALRDLQGRVIPAGES